MCINCPQLAWDFEKCVFTESQTVERTVQDNMHGAVPTIFHAVLQRR